MRPTRAEHRSDTAPRQPRLARLAHRQHGAVAWRQLRGLGFSEQEIDTLVARGHLIRVHRGVYAVGHTRLSVHGLWVAAVLACGPAARLSHADAAALHDLRRPPTGAIHVTAPSHHRHRGVHCHTTRHPNRLGTTVLDGIPVTTLKRTLLDLAATAAPQRLRTLLEDVQRHGGFDLRGFDGVLATANGHRGAGRLRAALATLADIPPAIRSRNEARLLELVRDAGLPEPHTNSVVGGEVVDFHWPAHGLVVELDSDHFHRTAADRVRDTRIGAAVDEARQTLRRIGDDRLDADPQGLVADLAAWLELSRPSPRPRPRRRGGGAA